MTDQNSNQFRNMARE